MAKKIIVLNSSKPRISKVVAVLLVRRALADWLDENHKDTIVMRPIREFSNAIDLPARIEDYIPEFLPSAEANTKFAGPVSKDASVLRRMASHFCEPRRPQRPRYLARVSVAMQEIEMRANAQKTA